MSDLIRRSDAIKATLTADVNDVRLEDVIAVTGVVADAIEAIPTIEPKRGKWIFQFRDSENEAYICSKCGSMQGFKHNFCPNCGADMKGADDE